MNNFCSNRVKEKDQANIIPINSKKAINFYEDFVLNLFEKFETKKKIVTKTDKDNIFERQNNEEIKNK